MHGLIPVVETHSEAHRKPQYTRDDAQRCQAMWQLRYPMGLVVGAGLLNTRGGCPKGCAMAEAKKKFSFRDVFLAVQCVVFTCDAAAPAAAIGNSQFFWWVLLTFTFLLPYGFVVAELGTTYDSEGGLYDWVRDAFGDRWGARVAWLYWINYPIWLASMAVLFPSTMAGVIGAELSPVMQIVVELAFIWAVVWLGNFRVEDSGWLMNGVAVLKVAIAMTIGIAGLWYATTYGFVNPITFKSLIPDFSDTNSLAYLSIILFNFMGFEVVTTFAGDMNNPERDMPLAILLGGFTIAAIYLFSSFGIGAAIPVDQISTDSGLTDALAVMVGPANPLYAIMSVAFLLTLFGNGVSWAFGVNSAAFYAARQGKLPHWFGIESKRTHMAIGASVTNGAVASVLVVMQTFLAGAVGNVFWALFSMQLVFEMTSYIPMFPAMLKLRAVDPDRHRPFRAPGSDRLMRVLCWLPVVEIVLSMVATIVPLNASPAELSKIPALIGVVLFFLAGEVVRVVSARGRTEEYKGLTPELAAARNAQAACDAEPQTSETEDEE